MEDFEEWTVVSVVREYGEIVIVVERNTCQRSFKIPMYLVSELKSLAYIADVDDVGEKD